VAPPSQPTLNQRYTATEREQTRLNVTLFVNVFGVFRRTLAAHNGLVAGSSPAGPTNEIKYLAKVPFLLRTVSRTGCSISLVTGGSMHRSPLSPLDGGACRAMEGLKNAKPDTAAHHQIAPDSARQSIDSARQSIARRRVAT
jgi:hypothetical protein